MKSKITAAKSTKASIKEHLVMKLLRKTLVLVLEEMSPHPLLLYLHSRNWHHCQLHQPVVLQNVCGTAALYSELYKTGYIYLLRLLSTYCRCSSVSSVGMSENPFPRITTVSE